jgi:hypothetical protein
MISGFCALQVLGQRGDPGVLVGDGEGSGVRDLATYMDRALRRHARRVDSRDDRRHRRSCLRDRKRPDADPCRRVRRARRRHHAHGVRGRHRERVPARCCQRFRTSLGSVELEIASWGGCGGAGRIAAGRSSSVRTSASDEACRNGSRVDGRTGLKERRRRSGGTG